MKQRMLLTLCVATVGLGVTPGAYLAQGIQEPQEKRIVIRLKNGQIVVYPMGDVESVLIEGGSAGTGPAGTGDSGSHYRSLRLVRGAPGVSAAWGPENLFDGNGQTGWSSRQGSRLPQEFIAELQQSEYIGAVEFDNALQEHLYPGCSAREVVVMGSNAGPSGPYTNLATVGLVPAAGKQRFAVKEATVRWVRILIQSNYGNLNYTQLMDIRFYPPSDRSRP